MIVRISGEGQYRVDEDLVARLNELDADAVAAAEAGDESRFGDVFGRMLALVRGEGEAVAHDELVGSDVILPPADTSLAEAADGFTEEGLIPG